MSEIQLSTIEEALEDFKAGKFIIVVDDEDRENEGDLITAAELITPEKINVHAQQVACPLRHPSPRSVAASSSWSTKCRATRRFSARPSP